MAKTPPGSPGEPQYTGCPHCTIQIPAGATVCPHCKQALSPPKQEAPVSLGRVAEGFRRVFRAGEGLPSLSDLWERHGKWFMVGGVVLAGLVVLFIVYGLWVGHKVTIVPNPQLPVTVKQEKKGEVSLLKVQVENRGDDIPDLSLKSVGVVVELVYRDGRREKKTFFPKAQYRGEGALLNGETGVFEIEARSKDLKEVVLRSEIVDLGLGRKLVLPGAVRR